jgi:hypothetical protein
MVAETPWSKWKNKRGESERHCLLVDVGLRIEVVSSKRRPPCPSIDRIRSLPILFRLVIALFLLSNVLLGQQAKSLPTIAPGTVVGDPNAARWNRTVLIAKPQISSGDVDKLSESIRNAVSKFNLTILATLQLSGNGQQPNFKLGEIAVAYAMIIQDRLVTITTDSASKLGAKLDFVSYQMLSQNEKQLATISVVARTDTLTIFDTPAMMLSEGEHRDLIMRHFIWIDTSNGRLGMIVWLLKQDAKSHRLFVAEDRFRYVPANSKEDRKIHVDGNEFLVGIPSRRAFALEGLPPGKDFKWTVEARSLAAETTYTAELLGRLAQALNVILATKPND